MKKYPLSLAGLLLECLFATALLAAVSSEYEVREPSPAPPGVVIDYSSASTGQYIGSPAIAVLPDGDYVATHDYFGPKSTEETSAVSRVFRSSDRGATWRHLTDIQGAFWSSLFFHDGHLYLLGTTKNYGFLVIRRSDDGGQTWTDPKDENTGLLRNDGRYHTAPVPVSVRNGRVWRGVERVGDPKPGEIAMLPYVISAPENADLLKASSWTFSDTVVGQQAWLDGLYGGCIEGNAVFAPDGELLNIIRVQWPRYEEKAAIFHLSPDGRKMIFDPKKDFCDFPGGSKKFTIRFDPQTNLYWTLCNYVPPEKRSDAHPSATRHTLVLASSPDLRHWTVRKTLLEHPERERHGFQYVDWLFDGDDLIAVVRMAFDDAEGGAHNFHDANYLTFHRFSNFRQ